MLAPDLIAEAAVDRVLIVGSLPPRGRDLDLLVRPADARVVADALSRGDFEHDGRTFARFADCRAEVVELALAETWRLPPAQLDALFSEARPLSPSSLVCRPSPHHALLILARRVVRESPRLRPKRRDRISAELADDPRAFDRARGLAPAWGASRSLAMLETAFRSGAPMSARARRRAVHEELRGPMGSARAFVASWRAVLRRPRLGLVIAFSGLDGAGKSSQVAALAESLDRLGADVAVAWTSVAFHPGWLFRLARVVKRLLAAVARMAGMKPEADQRPGVPRGAEDPGQALRRRSGLLTFGWSMTVTMLLAFEVMRRVWPPLLRGKVVICDRHLLDAWAHLIYQYGSDREYRLQVGILKAVFPRPKLAYLLEVSAATAARRKPDYDPAQNARRAAIYRGKARELGITMLDGERPIDELCAGVARQAWATLREAR